MWQNNAHREQRPNTVFQLTACGARDHAEQYHMPSRKAIEWSIFLLLLIVGTALVLFATSQHVSKEQDNVYFALAMLILPAITFLLSCERFGMRLVRAVLTISYWFIFYAQYVSYQNRPWFAIPDRGRCDGPCFGWYSFENPPISGVLLVVGVMSLLGGSVIYALVLGVRRLWRAVTTWIENQPG